VFFERWPPVKYFVLTALVLMSLVASSCTSDATSGDDVTTLPSEDQVTIYGDGSIRCPDHRADDLSLPVGTVVFQPGDGEIRVTVTLTDAAPNASYEFIEVWSDESCTTHLPMPLGPRNDPFIETDENGAGGTTFLIPGVGPGTYRLNVNLCCGAPPGGVPDATGPQGPGSVPEDFRHREMGTAQFTEVTVQ
jgi:hypothetical protein